jgi:hypothetical protein
MPAGLQDELQNFAHLGSQMLQSDGTIASAETSVGNQIDTKQRCRKHSNAVTQPGQKKLRRNTLSGHKTHASCIVELLNYMSQQTNNESLAAVAAEIATQFAAGNLAIAAGRSSKVAELLTIGDTLQELHKGGLRAPAIAAALQARGQKFSSATIRRALKIILKSKTKSTVKSPAIVPAQPPISQTAEQPTTKTPIKLGKAKATAQTPAMRSAGGLTDAEIEAKLKDQ